MVDLEDCWPMVELKVNILLIQTQQAEQWHLLNYLTGFISSKYWVQRLYNVKFEFEFWFDNWRFTFKRQWPNFQTDSRLVGRQSFVRSTFLVMFCKSVYQLGSVFHFSSRLVADFVKSRNTRYYLQVVSAIYEINNYVTTVKQHAEHLLENKSLCIWCAMPFL